MNLKNKRTSNKGITLIVLVITIIVLLILSGVTISTLTGDNGILKKAVEAKNKTIKAEAKEAIQLETMGSIDNTGKFNYDDFKVNLKRNLGLLDKDVVDNEDGTCTVTYKGYDVTVDTTTGKVTSSEKETFTTGSDKQAPSATVTLNSTSVTVGENIIATVEHIDNDSGVKISACRWKFTTSPDEIGINPNNYTEGMCGTFISVNQNIECQATEAGTYWLHVLTVDRFNNQKETISSTSVMVSNGGLTSLETGQVYYADVDDDGTPDGVIFVDLTKGCSGQWMDSFSSYSIAASVTNPKTYTISQENYEGDFGTGPVLTSSGTGVERFYVMSLSDAFDGEVGFPGGSYPGRPPLDAGAWFMPSNEEWSAFLGELGIDGANRSSKGLGVNYWSGTRATYEGFIVSFYAERIVSANWQEARDENLYFRIRLATIF